MCVCVCIRWANVVFSGRSGEIQCAAETIIGHDRTRVTYARAPRVVERDPNPIPRRIINACSCLVARPNPRAIVFPTVYGKRFLKRAHTRIERVLGEIGESRIGYSPQLEKRERKREIPDTEISDGL